MNRELLSEYKLLENHFHFKGKELIDIAISELKTYEQANQQSPFVGVGTLSDPYLPDANNAWLQLALKLADEKDEQKSSYLKIMGRLVKYRHQDKYVSDYGNLSLDIDDATIRKILSKEEKEGLPSWTRDNKERLAFIYRSFGKLLFHLPKKIGDKKEIKQGSKKNKNNIKINITHVNEILNFLYNLYFLLKNIDKFQNAQVKIKKGCQIIFAVKDTARKVPLHFPIKISKRKATRLIVEFNKLINSPESPNLLIFIPTENNGKGPDYPKIQNLFKRHMDWQTIWQELGGGNPYAFYEYNISSSKQVRDILSGEWKKNDSSLCLISDKEEKESEQENLIKDIAHFFPLVIACIFISETGRNPVSFLTGYMLIDLIQRYHLDIFYYGHNDILAMSLHVWSNFFNCPFINDNYGGLHPMTHQGSYNDEFKMDRWNIDLDEKKEIKTRTRKKEVNLMIKWLQLNVLFNISYLGISCNYEIKQEEKQNLIEKNIKIYFSQRILSSAFMLQHLGTLCQNQDKTQILEELVNQGFFKTDSRTENIFRAMTSNQNITTYQFRTHVESEIRLKTTKAQVINNQFLIFKRINDLSKHHKDHSDTLNHLKNEYNSIQCEIADLLGEDILNKPGMF